MQDKVVGATEFSGAIFYTANDGRIRAHLPITVGQVTGFGYTPIEAFNNALRLRGELMETVGAILDQLQDKGGQIVLL